MAKDTKNTNDAKDTSGTNDTAALDALKLEALDLAGKLGQRVDGENIDAMGLEQLTELVASFKDRLAAQPAAGSAGAAPVAVASAGARYFVAPGKSLSCKRGILDAGAEVVASDVSGGREQLEFLASGGTKGSPYLVKR